MNDMPGLEPVAARDLGGTGFAAAEGAAFSQQIRPCGAVNGAIHAAAAEQRTIGGIYDCVDIQCRDVADDKRDMRMTYFGG